MQTFGVGFIIGLLIILAITALGNSQEPPDDLPDCNKGEVLGFDEYGPTCIVIVELQR